MGRKNNPALKVSRQRIGSIEGPQIPDELVVSSVRSDESPGELSDVSLVEEQLIGTQSAGLLVSQSRLTKVDLTESRLSHFHVSDSEFRSCNLSNVTMHDAAFNRVLFSQSKLSGLALSKGVFVNVEFRNCRLDFALISEVTFKHVTFERCQISEADFSRAAFDHVRFVDCELVRATFRRIQVRRSEMRRCTLTGLRGLAELRGMMMEWDDVLANAGLFAAELGIAVADASPLEIETDRPRQRDFEE